MLDVYTSALREMNYYSGLSDARQPKVKPSPFFICPDANKFVMLSVFWLPESFNQLLPNDAKSPLPVDVSRLKTLLLKLPNEKLKPKRLKATDVKQK